MMFSEDTYVNEQFLWREKLQNLIHHGICRICLKGFKFEDAIRSVKGYSVHVDCDKEENWK